MRLFPGDDRTKMIICVHPVPQNKTEQKFRGIYSLERLWSCADTSMTSTFLAKQHSGWISVLFLTPLGGHNLKQTPVDVLSARISDAKNVR